MITRQNISIITFLSMILVVGIVSVVAVPAISSSIEESFLELQADVNKRQAQNIANFIRARLDDGAQPEAIREEVQVLISNSQADRGFTCIIDRESQEFVNHPMAMAIGMDISTKKATFSSSANNIPRQKWESFVEQGESAIGELEYLESPEGLPEDLEEVVAMVAVPESNWTVSTHENISRLRSEIETIQQNIIIVAILIGLGVAIASAFAARRVSGNYEQIIEDEKNQIDQLLLNILPAQVAHELKTAGVTHPKKYTNASLLFTDLVGFTRLAAQTTPEKLVELLNAIFLEFDRLAEKYGVEKIKTIGDAYMVSAGIPTPDEKHAEKLVDMGFEMFESLARINKEFHLELTMRIGVNSGEVVAGVIGKSKFAYDLWGDTVNIASRMESTGEEGRVHVSENTYELLKDQYSFEVRGKVAIKGKGDLQTYYVTGKK
ncbi:MAG: adenylate/guanylate cyclase domain-containing protein [bacterium]|nr:adenylate/guanylate cyclase domain-containing protein [bacterium]